MNDAAQIRRCSGALRANPSLFRPPPNAGRPILKISNRESIRRVRAVNRLCDCKATSSARRNTETNSNRELEAYFFGPSRGGRFSPPAVRPRRCCNVPPAKHQIQPIPILKNSNRESLRLEINVTPTKQRPDLDSNRELEAYFFGPSRGGCFPVRQHFGGSPPAVRPRLSSRVRPAEPRIHPGPRHQNSNREKGAWFSGRVRADDSARRNIDKPALGLARGDGKTARPTSGRKKTNSRPPTFVAIKPEADLLFCAT
jgi:hypothetical protein